MSTSPSEVVTAAYFDGRSARAHAVHIAFADGRIEVQGDGIARSDDLVTLRITQPMGSSPRLISFSDGAHCEVRDLDGFARLLATHGQRAGWLSRLEAGWRWALVAVAISVFSVFAAYRWGLPVAAEWAARRAPEKLLAQIDAQTLPLLDRGVFAPTKLPPQRQQALRNSLQRLATATNVTPMPMLEFRHGGRIGANAMALPGGTIILTDELAALAATDDEILAVLAHELGHVERRHGLRMLIEGSVVAFVVSWYIGDVSSVAAGLPALLLQARYSREHEADADAFAAKLLKANGIPPARLAEMLAKLEAAHGAKPAAGAKSANDFGDYFSSHPVTRDRIAALKSAS